MERLKTLISRFSGNAPWILSGLIALILLLRMWESTKPPHYVVMHDVWIVSRTSPQSFRALAYSIGPKEWNEFTVTSCPDWTPTLEIQAGVTLTLLQFVEDREHNCLELDGKYAGYTLLRDEHDKPIISSDPRPSATRNASQ